MIGLSTTDDAFLGNLAHQLAEAQERMAAQAKEDREHWHHRLVAEVLKELSTRLARQERGA